MFSKEYEMSEKAFLEVWQRHGSPNELFGNSDCFDFLKDLHKTTDGLFIVDHFSYINYDNLDEIKYEDPYVHFIWKDFDKNPPPRGFEGMTWQIYGADYIFSLCNIQRIKFFNLDGHLYVLIMPTIAKLKEVKKYLEVERLPENQIRVEENLEELYTSIRYLKDEKLSECILHNLPFYSFLLQPKQNERDVSFSKIILMAETLQFVDERLQKVKTKLDSLDQYDFDEINASGNTIRTIFESLIKYYSLYYDYSLPASHYGNNVLGELKKHLKDDKLISDYLKQDIINLANNFSHDTGEIQSKNDALKLYEHVNQTLNAIEERMATEEEEEDEIDEEFLRKYGISESD